MKFGYLNLHFETSLGRKASNEDKHKLLSKLVESIENNEKYASNNKILHFMMFTAKRVTSAYKKMPLFFDQMYELPPTP